MFGMGMLFKLSELLKAEHRNDYEKDKFCLCSTVIYKCFVCGSTNKSVFLRLWSKGG